MLKCNGLYDVLNVSNKAFSYRLTAVSSAVDDRHTHCSTATVRTADGRRTVTVTTLCFQ
ncbi:MAG: hypothetical protein HXL32_03395 [Prevotellaceae bacterium]|nr:hypothetical protein [Prevotellaceae bacterium]